MRILALTTIYPNPYQPNRGPYNHVQLRLLGERHPVRVIAPILWTDELAARRRGAGRLGRSRQVQLDGLDVDHPCYVYPPGTLRDWYGWFYQRSVWRTFDRALTEFRPDLIYAPWAYPDAWAAVRLARRAGLPVVAKVHGSDVLTLASASPARRRRTAEALCGADAVVAVSRDLAEGVARLGADPGRIRVVYNGVDAMLFSPGPRDAARSRLGLGEGPVVLSVGNLVPIKGHEVLVDACRELARAGVAFTCHLIGEGPQRSVLERQVARSGLIGRVVLVGPKPLDELPHWYRAADVVALPSRSEGVPNVLLEAAACGIPFVASQIGGVPEIAHLAAGRLVPPGNHEALAAAILELLARRSISPVPGAAVRDHATAVSELSDLFLHVLSRGGRVADAGRAKPESLTAPQPRQETAPR